MRDTNVAASSRLLRWFLWLAVRKNKNIYNPQPINETTIGAPALMLLQGNISIRPITYFHSTKNATKNTTQVCEVKHTAASWFASIKCRRQVSYVFRRSTSFFKFKWFRFILGGSGTYSKLPPQLQSTHMDRQLVTKWCGRSLLFRSRVAYWLYLFTPPG